MSSTPAISLREYLHTLRRRWAWAVFTAALGLAVGVPIALRLPTLYRSSASLLVNQSQKSLLTSDSATEVDARLQAIKQEALSRTRLKELVREFKLLPEQAAPAAVDAQLSQLQKDVKVEITSTSEQNGRLATVAFRISCVGKDPVTVARIANHLALYYIEKNDAMRAGGVSQTVDFLKQQLDTARVQLESQQQRAIAFSARNAGGLPQQVGSTVARYGQLTQQLQLNAAEEARLTERRDTFESQIASSQAGGGEDNGPRSKLRQAEKELETLRLRFAENMPEVRDKRKEVAALQTVVAEDDSGSPVGAATPTRSVAQSQLVAINRQLDELRAKDDEIRAAIGGYDALLKSAPLRDAEFEAITHGVQAARDAYDALQRRYQDAVLIERADAGKAAQFQVLDPASPPDSPVAPNRNLLLALSIVGALLSSVAIVVGIEYFDESFRSLDELRAFTTVPVLGSIPVIGRPRTSGLPALPITAGALVCLMVVSYAAAHLAPRAEFLTRLLLRPN